MNVAIQSKQLSIGDLFRVGWNLYKDNFKNILIVILWVWIPENLFTAFLSTPYIQAIRESAYGIDKMIIGFIEVLIGTIPLIAFVSISLIVEKSLQGTIPNWGPALRHGLSKWGAMVGTGILSVIIVGLLSLLLIIPGIIWLVYYSFGINVVALRNLSGKQALDYSKSMVKGQWWRVALIFFLIDILSFSASWVIQYLFAFISVDPFIIILPNTLVSIVWALFTVISVVFFLNVDYLRNPVTIQAEAPSMLPQV